MSRERRVDARVAVPLNARLLIAGEERELFVRDVSRRGIFLYTSKMLGAPGAIFPLKLALTAGIKTVSLRAEVVRNVPDPKGKRGDLLGVGMRFLDVTPPIEAQLLDLFDRAMMGRGTKMRAFPRVYRILEVTCRTNRDLRGLVRDIGEGGCGLTVEEKVPLHAVVGLALPRRGKSPLNMQGWVVGCETVGTSYRVGIRFSRLTPEVRAELEEFLKGLFRR